MTHATANQGEIAEGFTRTPNWVYALMSTLLPAPYLVLEAAVRLSIGWNDEWSESTAKDIADLTGLQRSTVTTILGAFAEIGLTERGERQPRGYRWRLVPMSPDAVTMSAQTMSAQTTSYTNRCRLTRHINVDSDDITMSAQTTSYIRNKDRVLKTGKTERERTAPAAPAAPALEATAQSNQDTATVETEPTQQSARTPNPPVPAAPPSPLPTGTPTRASARPAPVEAEQPRLVDAEMGDAVAVYRQVAGVKAPNQAQRAAIREHVTSDLDLWREACDYFARNSFNVRKIDNVIDRYQKAVKSRQAEQERQRELEQRRQAAQAPAEDLTPEQRELYRARWAEVKAKLDAKAAEADSHSYLWSGRHARARAS